MLEQAEGIFKLIDYGHIKTAPRIRKQRFTTGQRLRAIYDAIMGILAEYPDIEHTIPREAGFVKFAAATKQIQRATGVCEMALSDYEILDINPSVVKKWARDYLDIGYNRVDKDMVDEAVKTYLGIPDIHFATDDESDAVAIGLVYGMGLHIKQSEAS